MKKSIFIVLMSIVAIAKLSAQVQPVDENGLAIGGYDVVAYFSNTAVKGNPKYVAKYDGATYQFSNAKNRDAFKKAPTAYLPQFDGYCAWGVAAKDSKFPINPETFDIVDGKLYLFFNGPFDGQQFDTSILWSLETTKLKTEAHQKWAKVKNN